MADKTVVRQALREALSSAGLVVQSDTLGARGELYVMGEDDLARALFEFHESAREAVDAMYQGSWTPGLPPRFAVLPAAARDESDFEMLEQMRVVPLLYTEAPAVAFPGLAEVLAAHL